MGSYLSKFFNKSNIVVTEPKPVKKKSPCKDIEIDSFFDSLSSSEIEKILRDNRMEIDKKISLSINKKPIDKTELSSYELNAALLNEKRNKVLSNKSLIID